MSVATRPFARVCRGLDRAGCHDCTALHGQAYVAVQTFSDVSSPDLFCGRDGNQIAIDPVQ